ncbi:MAG TPA: hypothetical protein VIL42_06340 [Sphingomicrobium sp.]
MNWKKIRLELAGTSDHPRGSVSRGYLICAPLDESGVVDEEVLARAPHKATVRRFWSTEPDEKGQLVRSDGHLALRCNGKADRLLPLNGELRLGARVDVVGADGRALPFRIASIAQLGREVLPS